MVAKKLEMPKDFELQREQTVTRQNFIATFMNDKNYLFWFINKDTMKIITHEMPNFHTKESYK